MANYFEKYSKSEVTKTKRIINTPNDFAKQNLFYVQEAGTLKSLKPHESHRKSLDSYLFFVVVSGEGILKYAGETYEIKAPSCIYIDCHKEYSHISSEDNPWELMWVHFNGPLAAYYYDYFMSRRTNVFSLSDATTVTNSIQQIISAYENRLPDVDIISSKYITDLLTQAICGFNYKNENDNSTVSNKLKEVLSYIDENYAKAITLDELSSKFFISKFYLARAFKNEFQTTIVQYILTKRINAAKELLRYSTESIESIASICGISDASYFNKVFKKLEGMTASQYRKQWSANTHHQ